MKGVIIHYRGSYKHRRNNQIIVEPEGVSSRDDAKALVGKKVVYTTPTGRRLIGVITAPHGNKGRVRVRFGSGVVVDLGSKVDILG